MQPRILVIILTLLPLLACNGAYLLSAYEGFIPWCIPYIDGCTTISRAARSLQARGLIGRATSRQDRRAYRLRVTASGRRLYRAVVPLALAYERRLLANLSAQQISTLRRQLRQLEQAAAAAAKRSS